MWEPAPTAPSYAAEATLIFLKSKVLFIEEGREHESHCMVAIVQHGYILILTLTDLLVRFVFFANKSMPLKFSNHRGPLRLHSHSTIDLWQVYACQI